MRPLLIGSLFVLAASAESFIEYSDRDARRMLSLAAGAYSTDPIKCVKKEFPTSDYRLRSRKEAVCDEEGNTCAVYTAVSAKEQRIIVSFRGTVGDSQLNLETEDSLKPSVEWYGFGLINPYFYHALEKMWPFVLPALNESSSNDWEVQFTGYSLGGALATLAAMKTHSLKLRRNDQIKLITFGEPRVGNPEFANNVDRVVNDAYRVVHSGDIVPHLPPCKDAPGNHKACDRSDLQRAYHHGTEVWYNNDMGTHADYSVCSADDEDGGCSNGLGKWSAGDHLHYFGHMVSAYGGGGCAYDSSNGATRGTVVSLAVICGMALTALLA